MGIQLLDHDSLQTDRNRSYNNGILDSPDVQPAVVIGHDQERWRLLLRIIKRMPIVHCTVIFATLIVLSCYLHIYSALYELSALLATYCSNILLFGLSDAAAQCIIRVVSAQVDPVPRVIDETAHNLMQRFRHARGFELLDEDEDEIEDDVSVFNDYGPRLSSRGGQSQSGVMDYPYDEEDVNNTRMFNFYRWFCFICWGVVMGTFQVPWYKLLNYIYTGDPTLIQVLKRVLTDQLLYSPVSLYCFFAYSNYVIEGGDDDTFARKIEKIYLSTLGCNYLVWPLVQFINFLAMPKNMQVPFSSSVGVLWNCFLSLRASASRGI